MNSKEQKRIDTCLSRYHVSAPMQNESIKQKHRESILDRHMKEFQFVEYPWENHEIILKMREPKTLLHSSDYTLFRFTDEVTDEFFNENHYAGTCKGKILNIGLWKDGEIYQIISLGKAKKNRKHRNNCDVKILRMCTRLGYVFDDGYRKSFSFVTNEYGLYNIVAYCDFSKSDGSEYRQMGMKYIHMNPPKSRTYQRKQYTDNGQLVFEY